MQIIGIASSTGEYNGTHYDKVRIYYTDAPIDAKYGCGYRVNYTSIKRSIFDETLRRLGEDCNNSNFVNLLERKQI